MNPSSVQGLPRPRPLYAGARFFAGAGSALDSSLASVAVGLFLCRTSASAAVATCTTGRGPKNCVVCREQLRRETVPPL